MTQIPRGRRRLRKGLTLIEAAMIMVVLSIFMGGTMIYYHNASMGQRSTEAIGQIASIRHAVRAMYAARTNYAGLQNSDIQDTMPAKMTSSGRFRHAFNGPIDLASAQIGQPDDHFAITFGDLPHEACARLATVDYGRDVVTITFGGRTYQVAAGEKVTPSMAQAGCAGTNGRATFTWVVN